MKNRYRLLFVSHWAPYPIINGATLRMHNFLRNLPGKWDVDVLCPSPQRKEDLEKLRDEYDNLDLVEIEGRVPQARHRWRLPRLFMNLLTVPRSEYALNTRYSEMFADAVSNRVRTGGHDATLAFTSLTYGYYLSDGIQSNISCDVCDSVGLLLKSMFELSGSIPERMSFGYANIYNHRWEKKYLDRCGKLIVISERDKDSLRKTVAPAKIRVVENGVDSEYFHPRFASPGRDKGLAVFTGVMNYQPNHDAMMYCMRNLWPGIRNRIPGARLKIVGRNPLPELLRAASGTAGVEVTGEVADIRDAVKGARVFLCPIRSGAGMKNKILEAFAMGIPVIATSEGAKGIDFEHGRVGYVADDPAAFAEYAKHLTDDEHKWNEMSASARELAVARYSWERKAERLSDILMS